MRAQAAAAAGRDFVLIHGAWHGGWCWELVRARLEKAGHRVHTPTLPGLADRAGELSADIGLDTHIACVLDLIEEQDLSSVVLVGHSYGGMVITGVADALAPRIAQLVYLDAALPRDGESLMTYGEPRPEAALSGSEAALLAMCPDGIALPPVPPAVLGLPETHPLHDWAKERLTPHPLKTLTDPIRLTRTDAPLCPRTYIHCIEPSPMPLQFGYVARQVAADPAWRLVALATGHEAMLTEPDAIARVLLDSGPALGQSAPGATTQEQA